MPASADGNQNKAAAKQCLVAADKYIKESRFVDARREIEKAKSLDPTNLYVSAFIDRIDYFEKERKLEAGKTPPKAPAVPPVVHKPEPVLEKATPPQPPVQTQPEYSPAPARQSAPAPASPPTPRPHFSPPPVEEPEPAPSPSVRGDTGERNFTEVQLAEMKRQIEILSQALEQEKKAREEMKTKQVQQAVVQFRTTLEKAWVNGAPTASVTEKLHELAVSLSIPENVERTLQREVKVEMYSRAVKEVVSKRQLLRSSSSTLEWLRKVYQLSLEEYLEYESKFLMDLVSNQYKGTLFQITADDSTKSDVTPKLKAMGYAVVTSPTPESALEKIEKLNPNVIVCDSNFGPGNLSGIKFLHILRNSSKFSLIPFIFLTGEEDLSLIESSDLKPNEGFVKKPVNIDDLSAAINEKLTWFREYVSNLA